MKLGLGLRLGRGRGVAGFPSAVLAKVANRWDAHKSNRYSDAAHTTLIPAGDQVMGAWEDMVAGAYLVQSTTSLKPTVTRIIQGNRDVVRFDNVDDLLSVASGISATEGLWFGSRHGVQYAPGPITSALKCPPLYDLGAIITLSSALTAGEKASLQAWASENGFGEEYFLVGSTTDSTFYHVSSSGCTWHFVGANGATYETGSDATTDLSAQGLTAPFTVFLSIEADYTSILSIKFNGNNTAGAMPILSEMTSLEAFYCHGNKLGSTISPLAGLTSLQDFRCNSNYHTGALPSLAGLSALRYLYFYTNQISGTLPSLADLVSLIDLRGYSNSLTGYAGGGISSTCGTIRLESNLLTESAVDEILSDLVAAGRTSGDGTCVCNLGGTGNATPSAAGLASKGMLIGRGWTVTTN